MLGDAPNAIPIYRDLAGALARAESLPDYFMFGMAPSTGMLTAHERGLLIEAMSHGFNIVSRMHEFLNDDPVFAAACVANKVGIVDVRRPRDKKDRRPFSGQIHDVTCPRIAVLGTVCAVGKRATAIILARALNDRGIKTVMVGTGHTRASTGSHRTSLQPGPKRTTT